MVGQRINLPGLLVGTCFGFSISFMFLYYPHFAVDLLKFKYESRMQCENETENKTSFKTTLKSEKTVMNFSEIFPLANFDSKKIHKDEAELSAAISDRIRVLCWVMTQPKNHLNRAAAIISTWGKRCTVFFFVSSEPVIIPASNSTTAEKLPIIVTAVYNKTESRLNLWGKTNLGFQYAYEKYFDAADWFVKADDDTYLILENLRLFLLDKDPSKPLYYGCRFKKYIPTGYMAGGAGYVLSKEALKRLIEQSFANKQECHRDSPQAEDVLMGSCLSFAGVTAGDSRDYEGRQRFFALRPEDVTTKETIGGLWWYWEYMLYPHELNVECCSDSAIGFHYIDEKSLVMMEYLIYHVHPFGINPILTGSNIKTQILTYLQQIKPSKIMKSLQ